MIPSDTDFVDTWAVRQSLIRVSSSLLALCCPCEWTRCDCSALPFFFSTAFCSSVTVFVLPGSLKPALLFSGCLLGFSKV